jgi:hypothetical protein
MKYRISSQMRPMRLGSDFYSIPIFFVSHLSSTSAMAFNLRPPLSTISGVPTKALPCFCGSMDFAVPLRCVGHTTSIPLVELLENHTPVVGL